VSLAQRLNRRVTLQVPASGQHTTGEALIGWTNFVTTGDGALWAEVLDISGREFIAAGAEQNSVQTKVTIRDRAGIIPSMQLLYKGEPFSIDAVLGKDGRTLTLMCSKVANG
jgi:SPP1 family predicted phage head-tail adaptor